MSYAFPGNPSQGILRTICKIEFRRSFMERSMADFVKFLAPLLINESLGARL